ASAAFMANLSSTCGTNGSSSSHINEVQISDDLFFSDVSYSLDQEMQQKEHLNSEVDSMLDDNMITYDEYQNDSGVEAVPTVGYDEHKLVNATLTAELERCKIEMQALECNKVKHDLDMAIVERNKRNAKLEEENVMLKSTLKSKVVSIENLQQESKQVYWLLAAEIASQSSTPAKPVAPFVHTRPVKSDVHMKNKPAGTDLVQAAGTNLVQATGTDLIQAAGTNLVQAPGTDLVQPAGTDLVQVAGTDLVQAAGTDLVQAAGTDLVQAAGTDLIQAAGTDLVQATGTDLLVLKVVLLCLTKRTMYHGRLVFSDDELSDKELKQIEVDDQAIQTILLGHPEDIYAAVDSCELLRKSVYESSK
nr:hypothetical protein [Tanacetum cinerariifolium]